MSIVYAINAARPDDLLLLPPIELAAAKLLAAMRPNLSSARPAAKKI
jgi:hypothetical protein